MPRLTHRIPAYRHHKASGLALVTLNGRDVYLGPHDSPESRAEYDRVIKAWIENDRQPARSGLPTDLAINEILLSFWRFAKGYYRTKDKNASSELNNYRDALRLLKAHFGESIAAEFSPRVLKRLRNLMIESGLCRTQINQRINRVVRVFKWAASEELIAVTVYQALKTVGGLQRGRSEARESAPVKPVADDRVESVLPFLSRQLKAAVELQRLTGMRPGEVLIMRTMDLDMTGAVWEYVPERHKTEHHGKQRRIFLGPRAQGVVKPWLRLNLTEYLFQPKEARAEFDASKRENRKSPMTPSQRARKRKARPQRSPGDHYTPRAYQHAIDRACRLAFPHPTLAKLRKKDLTPDQRAELKAWDQAHHWHPHQLRHSAATSLRKEFGLDVARAVLGHSSPAVTELYAEIDATKAADAMKQMG